MEGVRGPHLEEAPPSTVRAAANAGVGQVDRDQEAGGADDADREVVLQEGQKHQV